MILQPPEFIRPIYGHPLGPAGGLVCCFPTNEGSGGIIHDLSGHENTGIISGPTWTGSKFGSGLDFHGGNDIVTILDKPLWDAIATEGSIVIWFKADIVDGEYRYLISRRDADANCWNLVISTAYSGLTFAGGDLQLGSSYHPIAGQWQHAAITWKMNDGKMYQDGVLTDTDNLFTSLGTGDVHVHLGNRGEVFGRPYDGLIDSLSIYNRVLSAREVDWVLREPSCMFERDM